jgi:hypothetical protein
MGRNQLAGMLQTRQTYPLTLLVGAMVMFEDVVWLYDVRSPYRAKPCQQPAACRRILASQLTFVIRCFASKDYVATNAPLLDDADVRFLLGWLS